MNSFPDKSELAEISFYHFLFALQEMPKLPPLGEEAMPDLPDGLYYNEELVPSAYCISCGNLFEWPLDIDEFDPEDDMNLCGGSPRCCP